MKSRFKIEEIKQRDNKNKALNNWNSSDIYINDNVNKSTNEHIIEMIKIYLKFTFIFIIILFIVAFLVIKIKAENLELGSDTKEELKSGSDTNSMEGLTPISDFVKCPIWRPDPK